MMATKTSDPLVIFLVFWVVFEFLAVVLVNTLSSLPNDPTGWFLNSTGDISDKYYLSITPAGWAFSIWGLIYFWQALWILYVVINLFRTNKFGKVYLNPPLVTAPFLVTYSVNLILNIAWLFTWDRQYIPVAFAILALLAFSNYTCLVISYRNVNKYIDQLREHHRVDLWLNSIIIQNGILTYATWTTIATLLNFGMVLTYWADVPVQTSSIICLSILTTELVVYFILDVFLLEKHLRSAFMVYPVVIWATTAVLLNNWDPNSPVSIFSAVVVGLGCAAFVGKQIKSIVFCCRKDSSSGNDKIAMNAVA